MRYFLFILLLTSCAPGDSSKSSSVMSKKELIDQQGMPSKMSQSELGTDAIMYEYANGDRYQVEGEAVIAKFSTPDGQEALIQYWQHKLAKEPKKFKKVKDSELMMLSSPAVGVDVIFDPNSGLVIRKISYGPQGA